jgi:hypothetical protein
VAFEITCLGSNSIGVLVFGLKKTSASQTMKLQIKRPITINKRADTFDYLIEKAAYLLVASSEEPDNIHAEILHERAIASMIQAARSPFFGGSEKAVCYEGLDLVREQVFERVSYELTRRGYQV